MCVPVSKKSKKSNITVDRSDAPLPSPIRFATQTVKNRATTMSASAPKADVRRCLGVAGSGSLRQIIPLQMSTLRGKADMAICTAYVCF
jgi:hypothetical protein